MDSEEGFFYATLADSSELVAGDCLSDSSWEYDDGDVEPELDKKHCIILKEETMKRLQQNDISEVSHVLAVTRGVACALLLRHRWSVSAVIDEWYNDEDAARAAVGLPTKQKEEERKLQNTNCGICLDTIVLSSALSAGCGHLFCTECWARYVAASIDAGAECVTLRCPEPDCAAVAGLHVVEAVAALEDKIRFDRCLFRSYVESSRIRRWCPRPGCEFVVEFDGAGEEEIVICRCGYKFCWGCGEEHHHPLRCDTAANWAEEIRKIEKSPRMLRYTEFCPNCKLGENCNHYYERWALNHKWGGIARSDAAWVWKKYLPELTAAQGVAEAEVQFVAEAWEQMVEARRVLKWSYVHAYEYYVKEDRERREGLQYLQRFVEAALERLRGCAEKEMVEFVDGGRPAAEFGGFREKLVELTAVSKRNVENLVRALENDLSQDHEPIITVLVLVGFLGILFGVLFLLF